MKKALMTLCVAVVAAAAFATVPVTDQYIPALGHGYGMPVNGVAPWWRGDVWIFNPSSTQTAHVTVYLLLRQPNPAPDSRVITVNPGETRYLQDVIYNTFNLDNTFAGLRLLSDIPVVATAETYDANVTVVNKTQGTAGAFFAGFPANLALGLGESSDLPGFDQDGIGTAGLFRSNLAVVETTGNPVTFNVQIFDGSGNPVGTPKSYNLGAREVGQINTVITDVTGGTGSNDRVHVVVTGGTGKLMAVGSRMDNRTGDPSTIDMVAIHQSGQFEGIVLGSATEPPVAGGIQLNISNQALNNYDVSATIPCPYVTNGVTVDFSPSVGDPIPAINSDGTFSFSVSIGYLDGTTTAFTTNWTLAGARAADGTWSGTLASNTTGGTGSYAQCNGLATQNWRAAWTGANS
jgi:hypothetical protein